MPQPSCSVPTTLDTTPPSVALAALTPQNTPIAAFQEPPPPPPPASWRWRCCGCHTWYDLGCTRRCLECSHHLCSAAPDALGRSSSSSSSSSEDKDKDQDQQPPRRPKKKQRRGRAPGAEPCKIEFDTWAWMRWGAWRRTILARRREEHARRRDPRDDARRRRRQEQQQQQPEATALEHDDAYAAYEWVSESDKTSWQLVPEPEGVAVERRKEALFLSGRHDCSVHCDVPSECVQRCYRALMEGRVSFDDEGRMEIVREEREEPEQVSDAAGAEAEAELESMRQYYLREYLAENIEMSATEPGVDVDMEDYQPDSSEKEESRDAERERAADDPPSTRRFSHATSFSVLPVGPASEKLGTYQEIANSYYMTDDADEGVSPIKETIDWEEECGLYELVRMQSNWFRGNIE